MNSKKKTINEFFLGVINTSAPAKTALSTETSLTPETALTTEPALPAEPSLTPETALTTEPAHSIMDETAKAITQLLKPEICEDELPQTTLWLQHTYPNATQKEIDDLSHKIAVIKEKIGNLNNPSPLTISPETKAQLESARQTIGPELIGHLQTYYQQLQALLSETKKSFSNNPPIQIINAQTSKPEEKFICQLEQINNTMVAGYDTFSETFIQQSQINYEISHNQETELAVRGKISTVANMIGIDSATIQAEHYANLLFEEQSLKNITNQNPDYTNEELTEKIMHLIKYHLFHMRNSIAGQKFILYETYKGSRFFIESHAPAEQTASLLTALDHYLDSEKTLIAIKQLLGMGIPPTKS